MVKLEVYDITGRKVTTLINDNLKAGEYKAEWYTSHAQPGLYTCILTTKESVSQIKILVEKSN
jgi:hypothetical protein